MGLCYLICRLPRIIPPSFAGSTLGLNESTDLGSTWNLPAASMDISITSLALDPLLPGRIYAASGKVFNQSRRWGNLGAGGRLPK